MWRSPATSFVGYRPPGRTDPCWVRAELDDRMRLNNCSIAASYDTARIFAGLGFGSSTASRSIISRPRRGRGRQARRRRELVRDGNLALTRSDRVGASSLSPNSSAGGETPNLLEERP